MIQGEPIQPIIFNIKYACTEYTFVEFEIVGGLIEPRSLSMIIPPKCDTRKGVILSGRGPTWLYAAMSHSYHAYPWFACYDPRIGAIVVHSHKPGYLPGHTFNVQF